MPSQSHGHVFLVVALCLVALFLLLRIQHNEDSHSAFPFSKQYSRTSRGLSNAIGNDTLGFQKIFVINAPWRTDRKDSISIAASYSGLSLDWVDGVAAENILEKAYPPGNHRTISDGNKGSWRAHMNALRAIIQQNLTTGLILEDDADWDFRLRSQLEDFSVGARMLPNLITQAELHSRSKKPPQLMDDQRLSQFELAKRSSLAISSPSSRNIPKAEPYGRDWNILWLGHCGAELSPLSPNAPNRIAIMNDKTVPEPQYLKPMPLASLDKISSVYPPHTRIIHRTNSTLCSIAYAVTQTGARRLLYEFGIREFNKGYDFALSDYCNGLTRGATQETMPLCITVQPPIFSHHFPERMKSDITGHTAGFVPAVETRYVRWSVRMNLERLVKGEDGVEEQWPDTKMET
ncbi:uncharacterized protein BDR25DRAFT_294919 [Lindgomyces ingoldianus]|uniref:Uncharacterized protein n=1 Tax=Lindgomyces ingoldianus TaxID=673940 RepID=A0ACB6QER9_9PLEO|nr:uncharacterized protein BDR25DRAFT_294919 [Lindgomyces ingoldianus]KAF2465414.1 hypothetical protein BDR25DRAFT_294919 [Lindgomyces ingoldianus]